MRQFLTLARNDDVAGRAPRLRYPFAVVGVGRERALRRQDCSDRETAAEQGRDHRVARFRLKR